MKYQANPILVDAYRIVDIGPLQVEGNLLILEDGAREWATREMTARMTPKVGDYFVIQKDGYAYLNPQDVFERKYTRLE